MHKCTRCGLVKERGEFHKAAKGASGLQSSCKACAREYARSWRADNPQKAAEYTRRYELKDPERRKAMRAISDAAYAPRRLELARVREERDRDKRNAMARERIAKNRDKHNEKSRRWRQANPEKSKAAMRRWQQANPGRVKANTARWRKAIDEATPAWANQKKIAEFYETADGLSMLTGEWYHVDHIVPLCGRTVRGLHCEANLQVLPGIDNIRKGNRHWPDQP